MLEFFQYTLGWPDIHRFLPVHMAEGKPVNIRAILFLEK